jgi:2-oxoisovalerate ferredoxin oxidoreductase beta subunit
LATLEAPVYIERVAITDAKHVMQARKAIRKAIQNQIDGRGFSFVEILSSCPTGWKMTPSEAKKWVEEVLSEYFKLSVYKDTNGVLKRPETTLPPETKKAPSQEEILALLGGNKRDSAQFFEQPEILENYRNPRIKIAGFGGQGILLLGQLMAESAMLSDYRSTWLPSYGPEMRGGTANCHVIISDKRIGSPLVAETDALMAMNLPSLDKFENDVRPSGVILVNSSLIKRPVGRSDIEAVYVPATELADELGETKVANMVMLGAYIGYTGLLSLESVLAAAATVIKRKEFMIVNEKALKKGIEFAKELRVQNPVEELAPQIRC